MHLPSWMLVKNTNNILDSLIQDDTGVFTNIQDGRCTSHHGSFVGQVLSRMLRLNLLSECEACIAVCPYMLQCLLSGNGLILLGTTPMRVMLGRPSQVVLLFVVAHLR